MTQRHHRLELALAAFAALRTPGKISQLLRSEGLAALESLWLAAGDEFRERWASEAHALAMRDLDVTLYGDQHFPDALIRRGRPVAPILFFWGDHSLFDADGVGMCGSRAVSDLGLRAARACGEEVSRRGLTVISGYAKGVDTETHLAALRGGGRTVIVLAEGFNHFKVKKSFAEDFDPARVLVVSQFPPSQPWGAYAAMARNHIIFGLGRALVVIEAGERGGTLAAGQEALKAGRPVFVLDFGDETPSGNKLLLAAGGLAVQSRPELGQALNSLVQAPHQPTEPEQLELG